MPTDIADHKEFADRKRTYKFEYANVTVTEFFIGMQALAIYAPFIFLFFMVVFCLLSDRFLSLHYVDSMKLCILTLECASSWKQAI